MGSTQKFRWTANAREDLLSFANETDETQERNWSKIATRFRQVHSNYKGKDDSLRLQYSRLKVKTPSSNIELSNQKEKLFRWSEEAEKDLFLIAYSSLNTNKQDWSKIATSFKQLYPQYEGQDFALQRQYYRTKEKSMDLIRLVNLINVDGYPNWTKIYYTFKRYYPNFNASKEILRCLYDKICDDANEYVKYVPETQNMTEWGDQMDVLLAQATGHAQNVMSAQIRDGRKKNVNNLSKLTVKIFKEFYKSRYRVDYIGTDIIIRKHFYDHKESLIPCSYVCDQSLDSVSNIDNKKIQAFVSKNNTLVFSKVFRECCHNCGTLFPRTHNGSNRKLMTNPINGVPRLLQTSTNVSYIYKVDEKCITCLECFRKPNWYIDYNVAIYNNTQYTIPNELRNLNEYEQNQIALCGGFYSLYQKQNPHRKIFEHRQGECNIGKKRDVDYQNMFTFFNTNRPQKAESLNVKIKTALIWLKRNNRLFKDFLSNYETIYGYLIRSCNIRPDEKIIQISKGNLADIVGKDTMGLLIPADNIKIESTIRADSHKFGIQHPLQQTLTAIRDMINVNYSDPDLEAKRWPHLFPEGNGSWKRNTSLKQQSYVKHRLLGIDSRFRKNNEYMFFWYDRLIKERLLYYNNRLRTINVNDLMESLQVKDVRKNENKYGSVVPSTISGSRTYCNARKLDLLALVRDLGKPELFVTLTQNDNWLELQQACEEITTDDINTLNKPIMQPAIGGKSVVEYPVETVVAFYKRLEMFIHSCIHNKKGPFGEVIDYWLFL